MDAKKQVSKKIMNIMKTIISLMCRNMQTHCKHNDLLRFCCLRARTKKYQANIISETQVHLEIDTKPVWKQCSNKSCQNDRTMIVGKHRKIKKGTNMKLNSIAKAINNQCQKQVLKIIMNIIKTMFSNV